MNWTILDCDAAEHSSESRPTCLSCFSSCLPNKYLYPGSPCSHTMDAVSRSFCLHCKLSKPRHRVLRRQLCGALETADRECRYHSFHARNFCSRNIPGLNCTVLNTQVYKDILLKVTSATAYIKTCCFWKRMHIFSNDAFQLQTLSQCSHT